MHRPSLSGPLLVVFALLAALRPAAPVAARLGANPDVLTPTVAARFDTLHKEAPKLDVHVLALALSAADCARKTGAAPYARYLTVIDYSLPSTRRRLWLFDLVKWRLVSRELVAHGANSGANQATRFSNVDGSHQSSVGLFRTAETYFGKNGYSLRLDGLEPGFNELARKRLIVMHGAPYVSERYAQQHGRLGRSWGCPALDQAVSRKLIDRIKGGQLLFNYYPEQKWLSSSEFLHCDEQAPEAQIDAVAALDR